MSEPEPRAAERILRPFRSIGELRRHQRRLPWRPHDGFSSWDPDAQEPRSGPDSIIESGWSWAGFEPVSLTPPIEWDGRCTSSRSWQLNLQAWDGLSSILSAYEHGRDPRYLRFAADLALDWAATHLEGGPGAPMEWYDAAVGLRAFRLAFITDAIARDQAYRDDEVERLLGAVAAHSAELADDSHFRDANNHGFYQAAGQLALATRFPDLDLLSGVREQTLGRVRGMLERHVSAEGVHLEHSPDYHYVVFLILDGALRQFIEDDPELLAISERLQEALSWFVLPNQRLAMFGDTGHRLMARERTDDHQHPALRYVFSAGRHGTPPPETMRAFEEAGYVVMRDRWPQAADEFADCSYLAQTCAFHSRVHKHADDLSFVWYDGGSELLVDAGRYGYGERAEPGSPLSEAGFYYAAPERVFVESTCAHNTVEIDRRSYRRAGIRPYGSALSATGRARGALYSDCEVSHGAVSHRRVLVFAPGRWLLVFDLLKADDEAEHSYSQRFNFAPELEWEEASSSFALPDGAGPLHVRSLVPGIAAAGPRSGETEPRMLGWISREDRKLIPIPTLAFDQTATGEAIFATVFSLGAGPPSECRCDASQRFACRWAAAGETIEVEIGRKPGAIELLRESR